MTAANVSGHGALYDTSYRLAGDVSGQGVLVGLVPSPLELTWFSVTGYYNAICGDPTVETINAIAVFTPRLAAQQPIFVDDSVLVIEPLVAVIIGGVLVSADRVSTFRLPANTPALNLDADLIWDVAFSTVSFSGNSNPQQLAPMAFIGSVDATPICLTSADLDVVPYQLPNQAQAPTPAQTQAQVINMAGRQRWAS
jgi:hypothetical protein